LPALPFVTLLCPFSAVCDVVAGFAGSNPAPTPQMIFNAVNNVTNGPHCRQPTAPGVARGMFG
jgi:hypothetical protein